MAGFNNLIDNNLADIQLDSMLTAIHKDIESESTLKVKIVK